MKLKLFTLVAFATAMAITGCGGSGDASSSTTSAQQSSTQPGANSASGIVLEYAVSEDKIAAGGTEKFEVTIRNPAGPTVKSGAVALSAHWYTMGDYQSVPATEAKVQITQDIEEGGFQVVSVPVNAPATKGTFLLKIEAEDSDSNALEAIGVKPRHYNVTVE